MGGGEKMNKRKQIVSLLSMMAIALAIFLVVGIAINWNLLIVIACFVQILGIGLAIILVPDLLKEKHNDLSKKIDSKITEYGKKIAKATK